MPIIKSIVGFILILIGSFMLLNFYIACHDFGLWGTIKCQGVLSVPLHIYLMPILGILLLCLGSFVLVKTFKRNLKRNDAVILKSKPFIIFNVYFLILIQSCILFFQIHELARYDEDIEQHMPTISREGNQKITRPYYLGTVKIPFFSQLILLPTVWVLLLYRAKHSLNDAYAFLISCLITSFSWCASITAIIFAVKTYD
jgi:hypothetical protein